MDEYESLNHTKWECKYHVIFIPKYRRKALYGQLRTHLGKSLDGLAILPIDQDDRHKLERTPTYAVNEPGTAEAKLLGKRYYSHEISKKRSLLRRDRSSPNLARLRQSLRSHRPEGVVHKTPVIGLSSRS